MTPLKTTAREARGLERNLGKSASAPSTSAEMSRILTILWEGWELGKGRRRTIDDVQKLSVPMLNIAKRFVSKSKKGKDNGNSL